MKCPKCNSKTETIDSRESKNGRYRRRKCLSCGERFSTLELCKNMISMRQSTIRHLLPGSVFITDDGGIYMRMPTFSQTTGEPLVRSVDGGLEWPIHPSTKVTVLFEARDEENEE